MSDQQDQQRPAPPGNPDGRLPCLILECRQGPEAVTESGDFSVRVFTFCPTLSCGVGGGCTARQVKLMVVCHCAAPHETQLTFRSHRLVERPGGGGGPLQEVRDPNLAEAVLCSLQEVRDPNLAEAVLCSLERRLNSEENPPRGSQELKTTPQQPQQQQQHKSSLFSRDTEFIVETGSLGSAITGTGESAKMSLCPTHGTVRLQEAARTRLMLEDTNSWDGAATSTATAGVDAGVESKATSTATASASASSHAAEAEAAALAAEATVKADTAKRTADGGGGAGGLLNHRWNGNIQTESGDTPEEDKLQDLDAAVAETELAAAASAASQQCCSSVVKPPSRVYQQHPLSRIYDINQMGRSSRLGGHSGGGGGGGARDFPSASLLQGTIEVLDSNSRSPSEESATNTRASGGSSDHGCDSALLHHRAAILEHDEQSECSHQLSTIRMQPVLLLHQQFATVSGGYCGCCSHQEVVTAQPISVARPPRVRRCPQPSSSLSSSYLLVDLSYFVTNIYTD